MGLEERIANAEQTLRLEHFLGAYLESVDEQGDPANIVDGLFAIARGLESVAHAIHRLGNADAATPMGGMEALGKVLSESIDDLAEAIRET